MNQQQLDQYSTFEKIHRHTHQEHNLFLGQRDDEVIKLYARTHWIREFGVFLKFLALAIVAPFIFLYLLSFFQIEEASWCFIHLVLIVYLMFTWLFAFIEFEKNELTLLIVTNERIIAFVQSSLFNQQISETNLNRIQEVTGLKRGVLSTFFDIGTVEIQTAGSELPLIMVSVKSPHLTSRKILDIQKASGFRRRSVDLKSRLGNPGASLHKRANDKLSDTEILKLRGLDLPEDASTRHGDTDDGIS